MSFIIEAIAWAKASPILAHMWWRRGVRRLEWMHTLKPTFRNPERTKALGLAISQEFKDHRVKIALFAEHGPERNSRNTIWWEAPVTYTVWVNGSPCFGMGLEFHGKRIHIRQLQGVEGVSVPQDLRDWPKRFVLACIRFAKVWRIEEVRLYKATETIFYSHPLVYRKEGQTRREAIKISQERMLARYNGTARKAKLQMKRRYGVWKNPLL